MKMIFSLLFAIVMVLGLTVQADAALFLRGTDTLGNQLIYDDDLDITWYDYTNGINRWPDQVDWADTLTVNFGGVIYENWRLPASDTSCLEFDCIGSEMGHLYYTELGNSADPTNTVPLNLTFFDTPTGQTESFLNLLPLYYWSGTEYDTDTAFHFGLHNGRQSFASKDTNVLYSGLAVHPGDVASIPEPSTILLFGAGLAGVALLRKRFKN